MDSSLLAVREINHKYIVVERGMEMKMCNKCGTKSEGAFCPNCGNELEEIKSNNESSSEHDGQNQHLKKTITGYVYAAEKGKIDDSKDKNKVVAETQKIKDNPQKNELSQKKDVFHEDKVAVRFKTTGIMVIVIGAFLTLTTIIWLLLVDANKTLYDAYGYDETYIDSTSYVSLDLILIEALGVGIMGGLFIGLGSIINYLKRIYEKYK